MRSLAVLLTIVFISHTQAIAQDASAGGVDIDPQADAALRQMSEYLANLKEFRFVARDMVDQVLDTGQKIQLSSTRRVSVRRPNQAFADLRGDVDNQQIWYDGRTLTILDRQDETYGSITVPDHLDQMMDYVAETFGVVIPLADLIISNPYESATANVREGSYLGLHVVGDTRCHHLAFRQDNLDWQIWIAAGDQPLPHKLVITFTHIPLQPQYVAILDGWEVSPTLDESFAAFKPRQGLKKVELKPLLEKKAGQGSDLDPKPHDQPRPAR